MLRSILKEGRYAVFFTETSPETQGAAQATMTCQE